MLMLSKLARVLYADHVTIQDKTNVIKIAIYFQFVWLNVVHWVKLINNTNSIGCFLISDVNVTHLLFYTIDAKGEEIERKKDETRDCFSCVIQIVAIVFIAE